MAHCPQCRAEIDSLNWKSDGIVIYGSLDLVPGSEKSVSFCEESSDRSGGIDSFYCPDCGALLFSDVEKANAFLLGEAPCQLCKCRIGTEPVWDETANAEFWICGKCDSGINWLKTSGSLSSSSSERRCENGK